MKKKLKQELQQLTALFILLIGCGAWILLTGAMFADLIRPLPYLAWMIIAAIVTLLDGCWVSKHFVGGEWI